MLYESAAIRRNHPSVARYYPCLNSWGTSSKEFIQTIRTEFDKLSQEDKAALGSTEKQKTAGAKAYEAFRHNAETELYERLAQRAGKLIDKKSRPKSDLSR